MKKFFTLFTLVFLAAVAMSCSKMEMEEIFNGRDKDAIAPISLSTDSEENVFSYDEVYEINTTMFPSGWPGMSQARKMGDPSADAVVINDREVINSLVSKYDLKSRLPDADFTQYSIIAGYYYTAGGGLRIQKQRVKLHGKSIRLYLKMSIEGIGICMPHNELFLTFYPHLPDGTVEVIRSDE